LFALEKYNDAIHVLEKSLTVVCNENASRAKILNNLGVVHYQRQDNMQAMAAFAAALEIQRVWLDNRVRRNSIIFDASVTMGNMGKLYLEQDNYHLSFFVNEEALLVSREVGGDALLCTMYEDVRMLTTACSCFHYFTAPNDCISKGPRHCTSQS